jgi:DNA-binding NarL/FixJ family response regulator
MINKYIKIEQGTYRNQDMSGRIFPILKDYQKFAGDREGGFVTVDCSELDGFEGLDKARINVPSISDLTITTEGAYQIQRDELQANTPEVKPTRAGEETDEEAIERIAARFSILDEMAEAVSTSKVRAMIVSGPPGIGKSYGVERALEKRSMFDDIAGSQRKFEVVKGAMSAIGLYKKLYEHSGKGHVVCFDDCDAVLYDDLALNLLKAALDTGKRRTLHWNTESRTLMAEGMPNSFEFHGGVIFITNIKFDNVKSKKLQDHLQALQSRCHYLDLTIDSMRDRMLRIRQIVATGMLEKYAMGREAEEQLVQFIFDNKHKLREISLRMVLKIADLWKMAPDRYQHLAEQTCMRPGA